MTFNFELGKPLLPFEQLMGVLPESSKELVPLPYRVSIMSLQQNYVSPFAAAAYVRHRFADPRLLSEKI